MSQNLNTSLLQRGCSSCNGCNVIKSRLCPSLKWCPHQHTQCTQNTKVAVIKGTFIIRNWGSKQHFWKSKVSHVQAHLLQYGCSILNPYFKQDVGLITPLNCSLLASMLYSTNTT